MTKHYSGPIANIGFQSANDMLKNALKNTQDAFLFWEAKC